MKLFTSFAAVALVALSTVAAQAAPVTTPCPGGVTATSNVRVFTVTIEGPDAASCLAWGEGNLSGNPLMNDEFLASNATFFLVDKSDNGNGTLDGALAGGPFAGVTSGTFTINAAAWTNMRTLAFALKSGGSAETNDWAVFALPTGTLSGSWSITGPQQAISHALLYGEVCAPGDTECQPPVCTNPNGCNPTDVPEPATVALLGLGLLGAGVVRRRK